MAYCQQSVTVCGVGAVAALSWQLDCAVLSSTVFIARLETAAALFAEEAVFQVKMLEGFSLPAEYFS